ncbi:MAG: hypothetical protein K8F91_16495, partial [Candidatus Obscuribacterales bacterium]|nr:hypothetical protein [Candidatus Obscuribacterales bacterium]
DRVAYLKRGKIAAIENIKGGTISDYVLFVRWSENSLNGTLASSATEAAELSCALLKECTPQWGRFRVRDHRSAASLINELVARGIPVEEAVPERMRLEQLFDRDRDGDQGQ